jgi:glycosyltransferase involved in cell wall biosynthesis
MFWVQDLWPESLSATGMAPSKTLTRLTARLARFIYQRCDRILVQSEGFIPRVQAVGADPAHVVYFPNWAERLYRPLELGADASERAEMPNGFRVMFAGNIGSAQSFETILGAATRLREPANIRWVVLGEGHRRAWMEQQVATLGLSGTVHYLGSRPVEAMPRYFALADVLLATLRRDPIFALTIPTKLQSYLACGRPVVAALDGEGARVVEEAGAGLTAPAEDADRLAEAVLKLSRMTPAKLTEMGRRGRQYFEEHFEREKLIGRLEAWMGDLVGERAAS